jgi:N-formylglutamate amidohydrolase
MCASVQPQQNDLYQLTLGDGPVVAAAIHHGHAVRQDVAQLLSLSPQERLREEDPFTGRWTAIAPTRVVVHRSRFEVDLNRPLDKAVYRDPSDAWGLDVWKWPPPERVLARSEADHRRFYDMLHELLAGLVRRYGRVVMLDLHSYNYRRAGPGAPPEAAQANPEVNVGTGTMDRGRWASVVDRAIRDLRAFDGHERPLDVRENVRFFGGYFPRWIHETFPDTVCALAIEVKKFFMDEWTGELDERQFAHVGAALASIVPGLCEELGTYDDSHNISGRYVRRAERNRCRATGA